MADNNNKKSAEAAETKEVKKEASSKEKNAKKDTASKEKTAKKNDKPNVFVRMGRAIKKFFKDIKGECKKVVWPDAKTVLKSTGIVLLCVAVLGLIIWLIDMGLSQGIDAIVNLAKDSGETTTEAQAMIHGFFGI